MSDSTMPPQLCAFLERFTRNTAFAAGGIALLFFIRGQWSMAYSIVVAAVLFCWSLRLQAQGISAAVQNAASASKPAEQSDDTRAPASASKLGSSVLLRVPLLLLALAAVLWYTPAQPLGVIYGVGCVLVGAVAAALETNPLPPDPPTSED